jgi:hypothetical protein
MIDFLKEYGELINLALFATIIGWLFHISRLSRTSLIDLHTAKLATKDQEISSLRAKLEARDVQYESQLAMIERQRSFFERLATLPGDERVDAVKLEYEMRLEELQGREARIQEEIEAAVGAERAELEQKVDLVRGEREKFQEQAKPLVSIDKETLSKVIDIATTVARFTLRI